MVVGSVMQFLTNLHQSITFEASKYSLVIKPSIQQTALSSLDTTVQLMRLDVMEPLKRLINESACVILSGGTMEPLSEFQLLMDGVGRHQCEVFSCEHIISANQCSAYCVSKFRGYKDLVYNYQNKSDDSLVITTLQIIEQLAQFVPDGLVVFLQTYSFIERIRKALANDQAIWRRIETYKKIFLDGKDEKNSSVLENYQKEIKKPRGEGSLKKNGAILISVIGGRLSEGTDKIIDSLHNRQLLIEGINFSDELGRCVVVFGMPYSNVKSPEIVEKMAYYDRGISSINFSGQKQFNGNEYYENLCMKAVNQAVGRSIRHKNDYATIFLVDARFSLDKNISRLASWIKPRTHSSLDFDYAKERAQQFFSSFS